MRGARSPRRSTTTKCCAASRAPPARRSGRPSVSSGSTLPDADLAVFRCLWERDPLPGVAEGLIGSTYAIETHTGGLEGLRAGEIVQQSRSDPGLSGADARDMDTWGEKTWLIVPLVMESRLLGVMILIETQQERRFDPDEVRMAGVIGEQAAAALHNALRHHREEVHNRWLRSLVGAGRAISVARDPDTALGEIARFAAEAVQSPAAFVYELNRERDALVTRARHSGERVLRDDAIGAVFPIADSPQDRRALDAGEVFVETISDPALPAEVRALMEKFGEQTLLNVPLRSRDEALGLLVLVENERERVFSDEELDFMGAFGEQVTLALTTARSATTDGLTGLANHRVFYERLGQELARAPAIRDAGVAPHARHRRLQGAERHLRASGGRRGAAPARPAARRATPPRHRPARRATAARSSPSSSPTPASDHRSTRGTTKARGPAGARPRRGTRRARRSSPSASGASSPGRTSRWRRALRRCAWP